MCQSNAPRTCWRAPACCLVPLVFALVSCRGQMSDEPVPVSGHADVRRRYSAAEILGQMPMNSESRCTGICLTAEALLDGEQLGADGCDTPEDLARQIYDAIGGGNRVRFQANLFIDGERIPLVSRAALYALSTVVADIYKQRYFALLKTEEGRQTLRTVQTRFVRTIAELDQLLEQDPDQTDAFCASGIRHFPDGAVRQTNHVVLIRKTDAGETVVYDPNDPGSPIPCRFLADDDGLIVEWTCTYRDTKQITTQTYRIVPKDVAFGLIFAGQ